MKNRSLPEREAVRCAVREITRRWREKQYDGIGALLTDEAVIAPPGFGFRVRGRADYVQSYRDYDETATTLEFDAAEPDVDVIGDVAVAVCPFRIVYEARGTVHREHGHDILVFSRIEGEWKVAWRTMHVSAGEAGDG
jgi:ketosteroid isomerase-like protein